LRATASINESRPSAWLRIALIRHSFSFSPITTCERLAGTEGNARITPTLVPPRGPRSLLEGRGLKMHFPVTDLTRAMRPHLCETRRRSRLALGRGYLSPRRPGMCAKFCWITCSIHLPGLDPGSSSQWLEWGIS
jgi:hypothetical protein